MTAPRISRCAACAFLAIGCLAPLASGRQPSIDPASPFAPLASVPDVVEAAAVFNNPAQNLLLSDSGRTIRKLLALGGVFTHTEHAWEAIAQTLGAGTDETIRSLLGKRVLVVWDGITPTAPGSRAGLAVGGLAESIDTRWMLMCDVDKTYLEQLRTKLRPVKRDIVHGRAVYAIEKGRYTLALLNADDGQGVARVLLAPRDGAELFTQVLGAMVGGQPRTPADRSILAGRESLLRELHQTHARRDQSPWAMAWLLQLDGRRPAPPGQGEPTQQPRTLAGVVSLDRQGLGLSFASDLRVDESFADAPTDLLDAAGPDQVMALASARSARMLLRADTMQLGLDIGSGQAQPQASEGIFSGPGVMIMSRVEPDTAFPNDQSSQDHASSMALTLIVAHPHDQETQPNAFACRVDEGVRSMIAGFDQQQAPDHQGRFPGAIRTHTLRLPPSHIDQGEKQDDERGDTESAAQAAQWPGTNPRLSWASVRRGDDDLLIASFSTRHADTARQVKALRGLAASLDALGDAASVTEKNVLMRGYIRPAQAIELLGNSSPMDLAISRLIDRVSCDIRRIPEGLRGSFSVELRSSAKDGANLGAPRRR